MIELRDVTVRYGADRALDRVSLKAERGECLLVTGPSGCGKSTLARLVSGLIPHAIPARVEGKTTVAGLEFPLAGPAPLVRAAAEVSAVFQNPSSQLFHLRVEDEVAFGPRNLGLGEAEVRERARWALHAVGMAAAASRNPAMLSGGEKQRVAIAAALAMCPSVLVLDEPTASLDVEATRLVMETLRRLRRSLGMTILLAEHRLAEAARLADRVAVLDQGRVVAVGEVGEILEKRPLLRELGLRRPTEESIAPWEDLLAEAERPTDSAGPILWMRNLWAGYGRKEVIRGVDLVLRRGDFAALVGDNGCGKTTLARVAAGLMKPTKGRVLFADDAGPGAGRRKPVFRDPRPGIDVSLLFQNPVDQLFTDTVEEEVAFGPRNYGVFDPTLHEEILARADLTGLRDKPPGLLSAGQQQRTALAACLALSPRLLILDEPTLGQDWRHLETLMNYLTVLNERGATLLVITHDYKLVHRYARRVLYLKDGKVVLDGRIRRDGRSLS